MAADLPVHDALRHGGPDALGVPVHDFSTNANAAGPCPQALAAVQAANPALYPDPHYTALREQLAGFHGVSPGRVLLAASASEAMFRMATAARQLGVTRAWLPPAHYGDVTRACQAAGLHTTGSASHFEGHLGGDSGSHWVTGLDTRSVAISAGNHAPDSAPPAGLLWACEPTTPEGQRMQGLADLVAGIQPGSARHSTAPDLIPQLLLDRAYEPLRLSGKPSLDAAALTHVWQLWSPNKALGLTGVRGAYLLAPAGPDGEVAASAVPWVHTLHRLAPSWPLGAHAVAMLQAWCAPAVQQWVRDSLPRLAQWKAVQVATLTRLGWTCLPSQTNYFLARPPLAWLARCTLTELLAGWRADHGVKLRDAASFGHPGWVRLGVRPPLNPCIWESLTCP